MSNFPQPSWSNSPQPWQSPSEHGTKELEHRLTELEVTQGQHGEHHEEHFQIHERHLLKLNLLERALLGVMMTLFILLQDKLPGVANFLKGLIP
ncbi:MAG: hypothetical protein ABL952_15195 [Pyrinomonadaceae bacterium]